MKDSIDLESITKIVDLMQTSDLREFEIEQQDFKLRICRNGPICNVISPAQAHAPIPSAAHGLPASVVAEVQTTPSKDYRVIKSPMVGTFYRSASPEAPPFVNIGDAVTENSIVCILEAMKVMNEIHAEVSGIIIEVLVENGQTIEFGQPLFKLKP